MSHAVKHVTHAIGHAIHNVWHSITHHPIETILGATAGLAGAGLLGIELPGVLGIAEHGVGSLLGIGSASATSAAASAGAAAGSATSAALGATAAKGITAAGVLNTAFKIVPAAGLAAQLLNKPNMINIPKTPSLNVSTDFTEDKNFMLGSKSLFGYKKSKTTYSNSAFAKTYSLGDLNSLLNEG